VRSLFADVNLDFFICELYFRQHAVRFARLCDFYVADAVLFEFLQEQIDVHWSHRSVLVSDLFLEEAVDELFWNSFDNFIALSDVMNVVFDIEETGNWSKFDAALNFLRNDVGSNFWIDENLVLLPFQGEFDALSALERDDLLCLRKKLQ
jgi:hypothetical protein